MDFREGRERVGSLLMNGEEGYSLFFLSDNKECVELSATTYSTIPLLSGTTFSLTVERSSHCNTSFIHTFVLYSTPPSKWLDGWMRTSVHGSDPSLKIIHWPLSLHAATKVQRFGQSGSSK